MEVHSIHHAHAAPYHPQTNGLVERANHTISGILASYVNHQHNNWDELHRALRSLCHELRGAVNNRAHS